MGGAAGVEEEARVGLLAVLGAEGAQTGGVTEAVRLVASSYVGCRRDEEGSKVAVFEAWMISIHGVSGLHEPSLAGIDDRV